VVELARRQVLDVVRAVAVVVDPVCLADEADHVLAEAIVHRAVELLAQQEAARVGPALRDQWAVCLV
jgi:hypothetical protein